MKSTVLLIKTYWIQCVIIIRIGGKRNNVNKVFLVLEMVM